MQSNQLLIRSITDRISYTYKNMAKKWIIVFTDPGSVDPDDWLALLMLYTALDDNPDWNVLCITGHFYTRERAIMTTKMFDHERFYITYTNCDPKTEQEFKQQNSLWPDIFGIPYTKDGKQWYPNFGKAFDDLPMSDNHKSTPTIADIFDSLEQNEYVYICVLSPIIDAINMIDIKYYKKIKWFAMGGSQANGVAGYNWGVSPESTIEFQNRLISTSQNVIVITSAMGRECQFPLEIYNEWTNKATTPKQKALMTEWVLSNRGNKLASHKNMCDPLTVWCMMTYMKHGFDDSYIKERGRERKHVCFFSQASIPIEGIYSFEIGKDYLNSKMILKNDSDNIYIPSIDYVQAIYEIMNLLNDGFNKL